MTEHDDNARLVAEDGTCVPIRDCAGSVPVEPRHTGEVVVVIAPEHCAHVIVGQTVTVVLPDAGVTRPMTVRACDYSEQGGAPGCLATLVDLG